MEYKLFLLSKVNEIWQYEIDRDRVARSYSEREFSGFFPIARIKMSNGNILSGYDAQGRNKGQLLFDPTIDSLKQYNGDPENAIEGMRILNTAQIEAKIRSEAGSDYSDYFVIENKIFGISGDHIDRLIENTNPEDGVTSQRVITIEGSQLIAAAVSHWKEVFISDTTNNRIIRVILCDGSLQLNGEITENRLDAPRGLVFSPDGELFIINGEAKNNTIIQYGLRCYERISIDDYTREDVWVVEPLTGFDLGQVDINDLTLARRSSMIFSEKINPLDRMQEAKAGEGHHGVSASTYLNCIETPDYFGEKANTEVGLVEYEPGGHTEIHMHADMEQAFYVLEGKLYSKWVKWKKRRDRVISFFFPLCKT